MNSDRPNLHRILIRTPNWLGDLVMALPAMGVIRRAFPDAVLGVAAPPGLAPLFEEITPAAQNELIAVTKRDEARLLRLANFDAAILFPNSFRSAWAARRAGIGERWGYRAHVRSPLLTRRVLRPKVAGLHQSAYYLELVRGLNLPVDSAAETIAPGGDTVPLIEPRPATRHRANALLERHGLGRGTRIVGLAPGAAYGHAKRWPPKRVAELAQRISHERGAVCVLVGAEADREAGREIESALPPDARIVNLIARTDLRLFAGVLARCDAFVSNDSGAMHLAAAVGVRVAAIFGPTDERATAPLGRHDVLIHPVFCRPCMLRECPIDHRCMKGISVDEVFAAVSRRLDASPGGAGRTREVPDR